MRASDSGFTLVEVLIALVLFSMIGMAGFSLLNAMIGVEARTGERLARLAELQRAMHVLTLDFEQQVADRPIAVEGSTARLSRFAGAREGGIIVVEYALDDLSLSRSLSRPGGTTQRQILLTGVEALRWEFFDASGGWREALPPVDVEPEPVLVTGATGIDIGIRKPANPHAVAAVITLSSAGGGLAGVLRRVVRLPESLEP